MLSNAIVETTTTTGTGDLTTSAVTGRPRFTDKFTANATEASADHFYYAILTQDSTPQFIESGIGYMSATGTLKRAAVLSTYASSTYTDQGASAVSLAAGTKNVICTGEAGAAGGLAIPGIDTTDSCSRFLISAHIAPTVVSTSVAMVVNRVWCVPFLLASPRAVDAIWFRTSGATSGNVRAGIYTVNRDGSGGRKLAGSTADQAVVPGTFYTITTGLPLRLPPGWYYLAMVSDATVSINIVGAATVTSSPLGYSQTSIAHTTYAYFANGSIVLPDPLSAFTTKVATAPIQVGLRVVA